MICTLEIVAWTPAPFTSNTRDFMSPLSAVWLEPAPSTVSDLSINRGPLVRMIVPAGTMIVAPLAASLSAARSEPAPLSLRLATVIVSAVALPATRQSSVTVTASAVADALLIAAQTLHQRAPRFEPSYSCAASGPSPALACGTCWSAW